MTENSATTALFGSPFSEKHMTFYYDTNLYTFLIG